MPIYEYYCSSCKSCHELLQKISDAPATVCPSCNQSTLTKQISRTSFKLTGDGWYVTDFRDKNKKASEKDNSSTTCNAACQDKTSKTTTDSTTT